MRYNLYYIFLEDKLKHPLPIAADLRIQKNLEKFFKNIKPERKSKPPIDRT